MTDTPRMPRASLPLPEVVEIDRLDLIMQDWSEMTSLEEIEERLANLRALQKSQQKRNQWAEEISAQANSPAIEKKWANSNDITTKPVVEVYEWPHLTK